MKIEYTACPNHKDIDFLSERLNQETHPLPGIMPFAFFIKDINKQIIAGLNGFLMCGSICTDQLWVNLDHRRKGLGHQLMEQVHILGRKEGCTMATVATMSFLGAQKFYEKLGYVIEFIRLGYVDETSCILLMKKL